MPRRWPLYETGSPGSPAPPTEVHTENLDDQVDVEAADFAETRPRDRVGYVPRNSRWGAPHRCLWRGLRGSTSAAGVRTRTACAFLLGQPNKERNSDPPRRGARTPRENKRGVEQHPSAARSARRMVHGFRDGAADSASIFPAPGHQRHLGSASAQPHLGAPPGAPLAAACQKAPGRASRDRSNARARTSRHANYKERRALVRWGAAVETSMLATTGSP